MNKSSCTAYISQDGLTELIAPDSANGTYNMLGFLNPSHECTAKLIKRQALTVGCMTFVPGRSYSAFGSSRRTSAGFRWYRGEPLTFVGTYTNHALFTVGNTFRPLSRWPICYYTWRFSENHFISVTNQQSARIMAFESVWDDCID